MTRPAAGAVIATAAGFIASQIEHRVDAKRRERQAALFFGEIMALLGVTVGAANRARGGGSTHLREGAPAALAKLALGAADALGLQLAGVDIFDCSAARDGTELMAIEVNSNPMVATLEDHGRWDLIETIWRANFKAALR